jgi:hypothetical protein
MIYFRGRWGNLPNELLYDIHNICLISSIRMTRGSLRRSCSTRGTTWICVIYSWFIQERRIVAVVGPGEKECCTIGITVFCLRKRLHNGRLLNPYLFLQPKKFYIAVGGLNCLAERSCSGACSVLGWQWGGGLRAAESKDASSIDWVTRHSSIPQSADYQRFAQNPVAMALLNVASVSKQSWPHAKLGGATDKPLWECVSSGKCARWKDCGWLKQTIRMRWGRKRQLV